MKSDREAAELREQLKVVQNTQTDVKIEHIWAVRPNKIQGELLSEQPKILHFSGHGEQGALVFENEVGEALPMTEKALVETLEFCPSLECVILNACYSASMASAIAATGKIVIGCDFAIEDDAAIAFSRAFYRACAHGYTFQDAFRLAVSEVRMNRGDAEAERYKYVPGHSRPS